MLGFSTSASDCECDGCDGTHEESGFGGGDGSGQRHAGVDEGSRRGTGTAFFFTGDVDMEAD